MFNGITTSTVVGIPPSVLTKALDKARAATTRTTGGCVVWTAGKSSDGYGRLRVGPRSVYAHRFIYEALVRHIPQGLTIDHLCLNKACVNLSHLEVVSRAENGRRGIHNRRPLTTPRPLATACSKGHERNDKNTYTDSRGNRHCRDCWRVTNSKRTTRGNR